MLIFYCNIDTSIDGVTSDLMQFGLVVVFLGILVLLPSFFEKKQK